MTPGQASSALGIFQLGLLAKLFIATLAVFYVIFAAVIYRQVTLMTQVLDTRISPIVKMVAVIQVIAAGVLVILALILG